MSRCHNCQRDPDEYDRELRRLTQRINDLKMALGDNAGWFDRARASEIELRKLTEALATERFEIGRYMNLLDELRMDISAAQQCLPPRHQGAQPTRAAQTAADEGGMKDVL